MALMRAAGFCFVFFFLVLFGPLGFTSERRGEINQAIARVIKAERRCHQSGRAAREFGGGGTNKKRRLSLSLSLSGIRPRRPTTATSSRPRAPPSSGRRMAARFEKVKKRSENDALFDVVE